MRNDRNEATQRPFELAALLLALAVPFPPGGLHEKEGEETIIAQAGPRGGHRDSSTRRFGGA